MKQTEDSGNPKEATVWPSPAICHGCAAGDHKTPWDWLAAEALPPSLAQKYLKDPT